MIENFRERWPLLYLSSAFAVGDSLSSAEQHEQHRLLSMHAIFRLIEDNRLRSIENSVCDLGVAVSRKAVHEDSIGLRMRHQGFIDLVGLEDGSALRRFMLEAHAGADVGVNSVCSASPL